MQIKRTLKHTQFTAEKTNNENENAGKKIKKYKTN